MTLLCVLVLAGDLVDEVLNETLLLAFLLLIRWVFSGSRGLAFTAWLHLGNVTFFHGDVFFDLYSLMSRLIGNLRLLPAGQIVNELSGTIRSGRLGSHTSGRRRRWLLLKKHEVLLVALIQLQL